jgi:hypothetical protein
MPARERETRRLHHLHGLPCRRHLLLRRQPLLLLLVLEFRLELVASSFAEELDAGFAVLYILSY